MGYFQTPWHIVLLLLIALLLFGGKRLPEIGRSLGSGMREFKDGITGHSDSEQREAPPAKGPELPSAKPELPSAKGPGTSAPRPRARDASSPPPRHETE